MKYKLDPTLYSIEFNVENTLHIKVETERLIIRSITSNDEEEYIKLLSNPKVMQKFSFGVPYTVNEIKAWLKLLTSLWQANDPFSGYAVLDKNLNKFIGVITIRSNNPGECIPAYLFHHECWGQGFGSETARAVIQFLIPKLMLNGYKASHQSLKKMIATVRCDNGASKSILTNVGFKEQGLIHEYGALRFSLCLFGNSIRNEYLNFFTRRNLKTQQQKYTQMIDEEVDITSKEMANSVFGYKRTYLGR